MRIFRIERQKYVHDTLKGIGAALSEGARWNSFGTRLVYTAATRSLSMLEVFVHMDLAEDLPTDRVFVEIDIPDSIQILNISANDLPRDWDSKPPTSRTQYLGDNFVKDAEYAVMKVPSSIISEEYNYLINPVHLDARKIKVVSTKPFLFDERFNG